MIYSDSKGIDSNKIIVETGIIELLHSFRFIFVIINIIFEVDLKEGKGIINYGRRVIDK